MPKARRRRADGDDLKILASVEAIRTQDGTIVQQGLEELPSFQMLQEQSDRNARIAETKPQRAKIVDEKDVRDSTFHTKPV